MTVSAITAFSEVDRGAQIGRAARVVRVSSQPGAFAAAAVIPEINRMAEAPRDGRRAAHVVGIGTSAQAVKKMDDYVGATLDPAAHEAIAVGQAHLAALALGKRAARGQ